MASVANEEALQKEAALYLALPPLSWAERNFRLLWGTLGVVACLGLWQIGSALRMIDPLFVSSPLEVFRTALTLIPSKEFLGHLTSTAQCLFIGLFIAMGVGQ